jgi:hypothetical protein
LEEPASFMFGVENLKQEDDGFKGFPLNAVNCLPNYITSHPRIWQSEEQKCVLSDVTSCKFSCVLLL